MEIKFLLVNIMFGTLLIYFLIMIIYQIKTKTLILGNIYIPGYGRGGSRYTYGHSAFILGSEYCSPHMMDNFFNKHDNRIFRNAIILQIIMFCFGFFIYFRYLFLPYI